MNRYIIILFLLFFSCEKLAVNNTLKWGCMDSEACNFNSQANRDDGSCEYIIENFDCGGNCLIDIDCEGVCGGDQEFDDCGECGGSTFTEEGWFCTGSGVVFHSCMDDCINIDSIPDMNMGNTEYCIWYLSFLEDNDDGLESVCFDDCDMDIMELIELVNDTCELCIASDDCDNACLEEIDECGVCGGDGMIDECGICDDDLENDNSTCSGCTNPNACNYDSDATIDNGTCQYYDCAGECGGSAIFDNNGDECCFPEDLDCEGECYGNKEFDCAGVCNGNFVEDENKNCCEQTEADQCGYCPGVDSYEMSADTIIIFKDDFENEIDDLVWNFEEWQTGAFNDELQTYTSSPDNAFIENGELVIRALRENSIVDTLNNNVPYQYTSARLTTQMNIDFKPLNCGSCNGGDVIVEVRAILPSGVGTWPAIWMLPTYNVYGGWPSSGEIDIMEHAPGTTGTNNIVSSLHTSLNNFTQNNQISGTQVVPGATSNFKLYRLIWKSGNIQIEVEDEESGMIYNTLNFSRPDDAEPWVWPFDQEFFILLNLAIGGNMGGDEIDNESFPQDFIIDYVKVMQIEGCSE